MKKRKLLLTLSSLMLTLSACGGEIINSEDSNGNSSEESASSVPCKEVIDQFAPADNSHRDLPLSNIETVRFHYFRSDNRDCSYAVYAPWQIWAWDSTNGSGGAAYTFDHYDDYGVYVDVPVASVTGGKTTSLIGFLVAITDTWAKDPDGDRTVDVTGQAAGGVKELYLKSGSSKIYDDPISAHKTSLKYARIGKTSAKEIHVVISEADDGFVFDGSRFSVSEGGVLKTNFSVGSYDKKYGGVDLTFEGDLDLSKEIIVSYRFDDTWTDSTTMVITTYFESEEFRNKYDYDGKDLGVSFDDETNVTKTIFKVWAPTSSKIILNIYQSGDYRTDLTPSATYPMTMGEKGVWSYVVEEDLSGKYYTYEVSNSKGTNEICDPYAKSAGLNGRRGMVTNFSKINAEIAGWDSDTTVPFGHATDASLYEMHVRDMTINPNSGVEISKRGKFLGLADSGTVYEKDGKFYRTGLDHLKELGITHVQIQPFYDFSSVDESLDGSSMTGETNSGIYNWGYDPLNYNVLEGSYSTDPSNGVTRIKEFKQMVMAMHQNGININMDVVYNHTSSTENSNFNLLVPNYYYRTTTSGNYYNGSGCGNEMASDRSMVHNFIVDSSEFWTREYHLSGFRFDLMGLLDNQTMIDVYQANKAINPDIMVYGEPWTGGASKLSSGNDPTKLTSQQTVQSSLNQSYFAGAGVYVGAFSDGFRNAVKGDNGPGTGYVQGITGNATNLLQHVKGLFNGKDTNVSPSQVLNYVSCHDNYTLYDQLIQTRGGRNVKNMYLQSEALVFTAQGVPFLQEGEEFMRTKEYTNEAGETLYCGNSYNVGDEINNMDYSLKAENDDVMEVFKELIQLRKDVPELRYATREEINEKCLTGETFGSGNIAYRFAASSDSSKDILVLHAVNGSTYEADGTVLFDSQGGQKGNEVTGSISLNANQTLVIALN